MWYRKLMIPIAAYTTFQYLTSQKPETISPCTTSSQNLSGKKRNTKTRQIKWMKKIASNMTIEQKNISKGGKKNKNYQKKAHNMNQDACTMDEEPTAKFPQDKGGNGEEYQNKTGNKQKKDCSIDNKPVACISEEREENVNLQTPVPKLDQGVCPMNGKPEDKDQTRNAPRVRARREIKWQKRNTFMKTQPQRPSSRSNSPEGTEGNGEYQTVFRKTLSFWTSLEDKDQTRNAPLVRARREFKSSKSSKEDDDGDVAKCKRCQNGQDDHFSGTTHNEDYDDYEGNDVPSSFDQDDCAKYDKPTKANNPQDSKHLAECLQEIDDPHCSLYGMPISYIPKEDNCAMDDKPAAITRKAKGENEEYKNKVNHMEENDCSKYDKRTPNISNGGKKNEHYQQKAHNMNQDACTIDKEPTAMFPQLNKGENEEYQNKTGSKQKKDCSVDKKPVACTSEEREKNDNLQTPVPKLDQGVCPMYDKPAANSPEGREGNVECQNALTFRKALSFGTSLVEDKDQTRNAPRVRARRVIKWQIIKRHFMKTQPQRPSSFHEK